MTDCRVELTEDEKAILDLRLRTILDRKEEKTEVSICYFKPDRKKTGGAYVTITGVIKKFDGIAGNLVLENGDCIPIEDVVAIKAEI